MPANVDHKWAETGAVIGAITASLLEDGETDPAPARVLELARGDPRLDLPRVYRRAACHRAVACVLTYFKVFARPDDRFLGAEIRVGGVPLDLLFEDPAGCLRADELKSGVRSGRGVPTVAFAQVEAQLRGAAREFGDRFTGVRLLWLAAPQHSMSAQRTRGGVTWAPIG